MFSDATIATIASEARLKDPAEIRRFQAHLQSIGAEFRRIIATTPSDLPGCPSSHTHSERLDWVDTEVINPIRRLLDALDPCQRHLLSLWPNEVIDELIPDFDETRRHLEHLQLMAHNLAITIVTHRYVGLSFGPLIQFQIVASTARTLDQFAPDLKPSRGTFDKHTIQFDGRYPFVIRAIYQEITGKRENLNRLIKEQVEQRRKR